MYFDKLAERTVETVPVRGIGLMPLYAEDGASGGVADHLSGWTVIVVAKSQTAW